MIDLDEEEIVIDRAHSPSNLYALAAAHIRGHGTYWLADWLDEQRVRMEYLEKRVSELDESRQESRQTVGMEG